MPLLYEQGAKRIANILDKIQGTEIYYDEGTLIFEGASVSFVEPISKRSRHAKQAVLFVELRAKVQMGQS